MKYATGFLAAVTLAAIIAAFTLKRPPSDAAKEVMRRTDELLAERAKAKPVMGWFTDSSRTIALKPAQAMSWTSAAQPDARKIRITVEADLGVSFMLAPTSCAQAGTLSASAVCEIPANEESTLAIKDDRSEGEIATSAIGAAWTKSEKMAERATIPNRVKISMARWQCIKNCPSSE